MCFQSVAKSEQREVTSERAAVGRGKSRHSILGIANGGLANGGGLKPFSIRRLNCKLQFTNLKSNSFDGYGRQESGTGFTR